MIDKKHSAMILLSDTESNQYPESLYLYSFVEINYFEGTNKVHKRP